MSTVRRNRTLRWRLRELEELLVGLPASLELRTEEQTGIVGVRAMLVPKDGRAVSAWGHHSDDAIVALHEAIEGAIA